mmetsp:Transcript_21665/g.63660  ORF Transcript_21665/g.63660 Transcript_21665/m.63660 type:complete len:232 (+) Transcript_21665:13113-13808(+)
MWYKAQQECKDELDKMKVACEKRKRHFEWKKANHEWGRCKDQLEREWRFKERTLEQLREEMMDAHHGEKKKLLKHSQYLSRGWKIHLSDSLDHRAYCVNERSNGKAVGDSSRGKAQEKKEVTSFLSKHTLGCHAKASLLGRSILKMETMYYVCVTAMSEVYSRSSPTTVPCLVGASYSSPACFHACLPFFRDFKLNALYAQQTTLVSLTKCRELLRVVASSCLLAVAQWQP